jgi:hypothetical protein
LTYFLFACIMYVVPSYPFFESFPFKSVGEVCSYNCYYYMY